MLISQSLQFSYSSWLFCCTLGQHSNLRICCNKERQISGTHHPLVINPAQQEPRFYAKSRKKEKSWGFNLKNELETIALMHFKEFPPFQICIVSLITLMVEADSYFKQMHGPSFIYFMYLNIFFFNLYWKNRMVGGNVSYPTDLIILRNIKYQKYAKWHYRYQVPNVYNC
jgi:hypothetical protein